MARVSNNCLLDKEIYVNFRDVCKKKGFLMNNIFEEFMREFIEKDVKLELFKNKFIIVDKDFDISAGIVDIETKGTPTSGNEIKEKCNFNTTLDKELLNRFVTTCKEDYGISSKIVTETFLKQFSMNGFTFKLHFIG